MESFIPNSKGSSASKALAKPKAEPQKKVSPKGSNTENNLITKTIEKILGLEKEVRK